MLAEGGYYIYKLGKKPYTCCVAGTEGKSSMHSRARHLLSYMLLLNLVEGFLSVVEYGEEAVI